MTRCSNTGDKELLRSTQTNRSRGSSPLRGTRAAIPRPGRQWDTVVECVPPQPIDVKVEVYGSGEPSEKMRARIRVVSSQKIRLVLVRRTSHCFLAPNKHAD